jgi:hypothetical protein
LYLRLSGWLVYIETYGADFLTPSFVIYISKHYHHYQEQDKVRNLLVDQLRTQSKAILQQFDEIFEDADGIYI